MSLSQTDVSFLSGIPFDNSYSHTRWFESASEQQSYFKSFEKFVRTSNNFQKITGKMYIDLKENVENVNQCNYLMFKNSKYSNKWFYCFITNVESKTINNTRVYFEVDVIQTWRFNVSFKRSFIVREHENILGNYNFLPESIALGNEYDTIKQYDVKPYPFYFLVICVKQRFDLDHESALFDGSYYNSPNSLSYYYIPVPYPIEGSGPMPIYKLQLGENDWYKCTVDNVKKLFHELYTNKEAVNNIVSMYVTDYLPIEIEKVSSFEYVPSASFRAIINASENVTIFCIADRTNFNHKLNINVGNVFTDINESAPKLRYYPFTVIELTDSRGNAINIKPEGLKKTNGQMVLSLLGSIHFYNQVSYSIDGYNTMLDSTRSMLLANGIINNDPQDLAVLDDRTTAYLQGAKNSLEAKKQTWESTMNYQKTSSAISGSASVAKIGANAFMKNPNPNTYINDGENIAQSALNYNQSGADYENKVNEQNAMIEDIGNMPPNLVKQGSNANMSAGNGLLGCRLTIKRVKPEYLDRARDYFHVFGYKSNNFKIPNLHTRRHWNYIQTTMINIQCEFYNDDILRMKSIFDNGITLWHDNDMYNYDRVNEVI